MVMTKIELRREMKAVLASLNPVEKAFESMSKCVNFIQSDIFKNAGAIYGFMPMKDEVDILPVLRTAMQQGKMVFLPKIIEGTCEMEFFRITDEPNQQTQANSWGIYEPKPGLEKYDISDVLENTAGYKIVVLVPGLAFGRDNTRLGRGKGFYDRFLGELKRKAAEIDRETKPIFCGVCYGAQMVWTVPVEDNDVLVDMVL